MSDTTHSPAPGECQSQPKIPTTKDRHCPYCHQAFTSSSLGRHLDLYIKLKNPKPPDGIHNVEEIRRIRGNITRRQVRTPSGKKNQLAPTQTPGHDMHDRNRSMTIDTSTTPNGLSRSHLEGQGVAIRSPSSGEGSQSAKYSWQLNKLNWVSTGVINGLPPRNDPLQKTNSATQTQNRSSSADVISGLGPSLREAEREMQTRLLEQIDRGKAADLALKEVLDSINDANATNLFQSMFDCNPFELDFPQLVLHLLPPPPTIFSQNPFPSADSWSTEPPDRKEYDSLRQLLHERLNIRKRQIATSSRRSSRFNSDVESPTTSSTPQKDADKLEAHISEAWRQWSMLDMPNRRNAWTLTILRAYTRAENSRREVHATMNVIQKQVEHLSKGLAKASNDYSMFRDKGLPPSTILTNMRLSTETLVGIYRQGVDIENWDYDSLLGKWNGIVKEERESLLARKVMTEAEARREGNSSDDESVSEVNGVGERDTMSLNDASRTRSSIAENVDRDQDKDTTAQTSTVQLQQRHHWPPEAQKSGLDVNIEDQTMEGA